MRELPQALAPMAQYRQFIVYMLVPSKTRPGKTDKFPVDFRTGRVPLKDTGGAHNPEIWTDASTAMAVAAQLGESYGVGFVFTDADPFFFLDVDNAYDPATQQWSPLASGMVAAFAGAAVEVSQSQRGLHIFGTGRPPLHSCKNEALGLELYHNGRFVALTGLNAVGSAAINCSAILPAIVAQYFPPSAAQTSDQMEWTDGPCEEWRGPADDEELIRRALRSTSTRAAFGGGVSFADLWNCNIEALARAYPDETRPFDANRADASLAQHLAFWTGKDCERIKRLMFQSALARDKWNRDDYLDKFTIPKAVAMQVDVLTDKEPEPIALGLPVAVPSVDTPKPKPVEGATFLGIDQQVNLFTGCVYVLDMHRVLIPGGLLVKPEQFKAYYGGYMMPMDFANEKVSRDAWEVFTQSLAFRAPKVNLPCFRPNLPPGAIINRGGQTFVNTYWEVEVPRKVGDAGPLLRHLEKVLPVERDRIIFLSYMAACVQHKGHKFQWAPLLQGVEGNGKTLFTRCVAEAVGRRYVHWPKASKLSKEFNAWMLGKVFYGVEDIYTPSGKAEVIEELKPMITGGDGLEIEGKGVDQISADVCGNFMFNSNHKDAVRKTQNDRRFAVFYSAQQCAADLARDGMTGDYFPKLYDWLRADGYAIVSELLHTFPIPAEFNPAVEAGGLAGRAPETSSHAAAVHASLGGVEQEIMEAIDQGIPGFCGGWISSICLERLLERIGAARRVTHNKRRVMMQEMGYVQHPALHDGRVNNMVMPDGGKPRLFVKAGSPALQLTRAADIERVYSDAQKPAVPHYAPPPVAV